MENIILNKMISILPQNLSKGTKVTKDFASLRPFTAKHFFYPVHSITFQGMNY